MNDKRKQSEPEFLTGIKAFIERKQNQIIFNLAQKELNLRSLMSPAGDISEREYYLLSTMEEAGSKMHKKKENQGKQEETYGNVETSGKKDILEATGIMLPKGAKDRMSKSSKDRKEAINRSLKERPLRDRIKGLFRTDASEDRALLEALEGYNKDLDYRTRNSSSSKGGDKPLKAEYRKAMDTLLQQAKLGKRS
tara:strand:+ start:1481 stop:2065 length:585 start_codon:yes stop_codon:yes gene_type:complete